MLTSDRPAAGSLDVRSPYNGRLLQTVPTADQAHVNDALQALETGEVARQVIMFD